ncbi:hypothetical protein V6N12_024132 [Hibiscus sabdariffa]|uniref:Uncharacterized protein n=1 Tax=Hibiscus sabdariffa TaxID=183260 RepID=A0ABR2G0M3_9ROSI
MILSPSTPVAKTSGPIKENLEPSLAQCVTNRGSASETATGAETLSPGAGSPPPSNHTRSNQCCDSAVPGMAHSPIIEAPLYSEAYDPVTLNFVVLHLLRTLVIVCSSIPATIPPFSHGITVSPIVKVTSTLLVLLAGVSCGSSVPRGAGAEHKRALGDVDIRGL